MVVDLRAQFEALTNQNRRYRIVQQYLVAALDAAEAHLVADFSANATAYLKTRRALDVACEQARERLTKLDPAHMPDDSRCPDCASGVGACPLHADDGWG